MKVAVALLPGETYVGPKNCQEAVPVQAQARYESRAWMAQYLREKTTYHAYALEFAQLFSIGL